MSLDLHNPPWLFTLLLAEDDTEESVMGSDLHQQAIAEAHAPLVEYARELGDAGEPAWYVSSQVTVITRCHGASVPGSPSRTSLWCPAWPAQRPYLLRYAQRGTDAARSCWRWPARAPGATTWGRKRCSTRRRECGSTCCSTPPGNG